MTYIIINRRRNGRLCQDGKWRSFAHFGTYPMCVRAYRVRGWAFRMARRVHGIVIGLPDGVEIDAAGRLSQEVAGTQPGFTHIVRRDIREFELRDPCANVG